MTEILAAEMEMNGRRKGQGFFKNYQKSAALHIEAAKLFETAKQHIDAARNYYDAARVLLLQKAANIDYHEVVRYLKKAKTIYRDLHLDDCVKIYEELMEIYTEHIPRGAEELAKIELDLGDYYVNVQEYVKGISMMESGRSRNIGETRVSLVTQYVALANLYVKEFQMYKKGSEIYRDCIDLYFAHPTTKNSATRLIFSYGVAVIAYEVSNKDEPTEVTEGMKKVNVGFASEVDIGTLTEKFNDKVFKENGFDMIREGSFLNIVLKAVCEGDADKFHSELRRNVRMINTDEWQDLCLVKIKNYFKADRQPSIL